DFVALSVVASILAILTVFKGHVAILATCLFWRKGRTPFPPLEGVAYASLVGFLPLVLLSWVQVRYLARYYPPFLILSLAQWEAWGRARPARGSFAWLGGLVAILLSLAVQVVEFVWFLREVYPGQPYWFPSAYGIG